MASELSQPPRPETAETFRARLTIFPSQAFRKIMYAYELAKAAHKGVPRDTGERFFEHTRGTALILLDECRPLDPKAITAERIIEALLHDSPEDTPIFGNRVEMEYADWRDLVHDNITDTFGEEVATNILTVTKPYVDGVDIRDKRQAKEAAFAQLMIGSHEALLVKMADRLNNLRDLWAKPLEKQRKKVEETTKRLFPIFEKARGKYPEITEYLLGQMQAQIEKLQNEDPALR